MRSFPPRCRPSSFPPLHWMTRPTSLILRLPWRYCCSYLLENTQWKCGRWKRRSTRGAWAIWFCTKPKSHQPLGSANDLPPYSCTRPRSGKKKKGESNVVQWQKIFIWNLQMRNIYTVAITLRKNKHYQILKIYFLNSLADELPLWLPGRDRRKNLQRSQLQTLN